MTQKAQTQAQAQATSKGSKSPHPPMQVTGSRSLLGGLLSQPAPPIQNPTNSEPTAETGERVQDINLQQIYRPAQPRRFFAPEEIEKLKTSIQDTGFQGAILVVLLPPTAKEREQGYQYELIYGASRCLAMEQLGIATIPAIVRDNLSVQEKHRIRLDENLSRANLNPLEELEGLLEVMADEMEVEPTVVEQDLNAHNNATKRKVELTCDISRRLEGYQQVLTRYHKGSLSSFRSNLIKFRRLPEDIWTAIVTGKIDASKALELGSVKDDTVRQSLLEWTISVQPTVQELRQRKREQAVATVPSPQEADIANRLRQVSKLPIWKSPTKEATRELHKIRAALDRLEALQRAIDQNKQ